MPLGARHWSASRGSALLTTIVFVTIILLVTSAILFYASYSHRRATFVSRGATEMGCAESGLQIARAYFADPVQQPNWNTYLSDPSDYNPIPSTWNTTPSITSDGGYWTPWTNHRELFFDIDGDAKPDVYIYIRDNADENTGAADGGQNWFKDIDTSVYVGAVCMSSTMTPRRLSDGQSMGTASPLIAEALLSLQKSKCNYGAQHGGCLGNGNENN
jgi:hypothetical protein